MPKAGVGILLAVVFCACAAPLRDGPPPDSTGTSSAAAPAAAAADSALEYVDPLAREVRLACGKVSAYWAQHPAAQLRAFDSVITLPRARKTAEACLVTVRIEDDGDRTSDGEPRVPFASSGWARLWEYQADGPGGMSSVFQLVPVRCQVEERWDGGDDSDSTYVPARWFEQRVACWRR